MSNKPCSLSLVDDEKSKIDIVRRALGSQPATAQSSQDSGFKEDGVRVQNGARGKPGQVRSRIHISASFCDVTPGTYPRRRPRRRSGGSTMRSAGVDSIVRPEDFSDSGTEEWGTVTSQREESLPGMSLTTATSRDAGHGRPSSGVTDESDHADYSNMAMSVTEFTSRSSSDEYESEIEEELIVAEVAQLTHCTPQPVPHLLYINSSSGTRVKIKWPLSNGRFLRAVEDTDKPILIIDIYRTKFKEQYYFVREIKNAIDTNNRMYSLMCFRYDLHGESFYLTPVITPGNCRAETFGFQFRRANKSDVTEVITETNSKYWYEYQKHAFPVLRSFAYTEYCLSIEKGQRVVLRNTHGQTPTERNYAIQIFEDQHPLSARGSVSDRLSRGVQSFFCMN
ncbi:uncharacterized protein LOC124282226 [Haliotis rubra]|uniref:uncharacterized protein LOC124282226 n=1 Tax=Haliotis rubra TaxID=36100 RepID=UPI001EE5A219|nr:uncharacterized protein LOC124282226 [Haliotis rubra]